MIFTLPTVVKTSAYNNKTKNTMGTSPLQACQTCESTSISPLPATLSEIAPYYTNRLIEFHELLPGLPHYANLDHARLVNQLRRSQEKFEDMVCPHYQLLRGTQGQWKRVTEVRVGEGWGRGSGVGVEYGLGNGKEVNSSISKAIKELSAYPDLVKKVFTNTEVSKEGFYVLYFCLGGNVQRRVEIVIDDYVPVNKEGAYLLNEPNKGDGIWPLLVEKAWAKILGSYDQLPTITPTQYLSQMTGIPLMQLYKPGDCLKSGKYDFQPYESKYLKICRQTPTKMLICIWQQNEAKALIKNFSQSELAVQLIYQNPTAKGIQHIDYPLNSLYLDDKLLLLQTKLSQQMFLLDKGQYIVHIYNRTLQRKQYNIVLHSRSPVQAHTRYEQQFQQAKMLMVQDTYKQRHAHIQPQYEYPGVELRFCWIRHRGVFCFSNTSKDSISIEMGIKSGFTQQIRFEDSEGVSTKKVKLLSGENAFFSVVRREDKEYGSFYEIKIHKQN